MAEAGLKRPIGIYVLAILFILAPLGNILISFAGSGVGNWFEPSIFLALLQTIPAFDWVWLSLLALTGILLFRPHKLSWSVAIVTLCLILVVNAYRMFSTDVSSIDPQYLKVFSIISLFCTLGVLMIAFYFRFPYLDRRANWIKNIERYDLRTEVRMDRHLVLTESVSITGCKLITQENLNMKVNESVTATFTEISNQPIQCVVVESKPDYVRLEFAPGQEAFIAQLKSWIKSKIGS